MRDEADGRVRACVMVGVRLNEEENKLSNLSVLPLPPNDTHTLSVKPYLQYVAKKIDFSVSCMFYTHGSSVQLIAWINQYTLATYDKFHYFKYNKLFLLNSFSPSN